MNDVSFSKELFLVSSSEYIDVDKEELVGIRSTYVYFGCLAALRVRSLEILLMVMN